MAARVPAKHSRDQNHQDFEGLLNNLQDWELSSKDKDKRLKSQSQGKDKLDLPAQKHSVGNASQLSSSSRVGEMPATRKSGSGYNVDSSGKRDYLRDYDALSKLSGAFMTEESPVDANSEKELGNDYFKKKNFNEAIDCYSRSIALSPTAVAYANRAMAYIKIKRFQEAESDCTEALNLDDHYTKAYSRRSTARKELGKLKESLEDADFALKLEPQNQEIKKQYAEVKSLLEKAILNKALKASSSSSQGLKKAVKSKVVAGKSVDIDKSLESNSDSRMVVELQDDQAKGNSRTIPLQTSASNHNNDMQTKNANGKAPQGSGLNTGKGNKTIGKQDLKPSVQELATRAATLAMAEAAKNLSPPNSAYQFEASWRALSGDRNLQARLLKATTPASLPQIFKNALSAPLLMDIVRCIGTFLIEDMDLAVKYLQNLTKIPRFDMIIMCLSSTDKADLVKLWSEAFSKAAPENGEILGQLRTKFRLNDQGQWYKQHLEN